LVVAAPFLKKSGLEIIPTGYMLIDGGRQTSVEYMSNTNPIPFDKKDIAIATAIAGEMLGLKMIYMDAGSGSQRIVYNEMISEVKNNIDIPLIIGGGIKNIHDLADIYKAGADLVVISTAVEENPEMIFEFTSWLHK
jgi:phosphoglycerol geranylgeranyltransferase